MKKVFLIGAVLASALACVSPDSFTADSDVGSVDSTLVTGDMNVGRAHHTLTRVTDGPEAGVVIAVGGYYYGVIDSVERYDPDSGTWFQKSPLLQPRERHRAVLASGELLVVGGKNATGTLATIEHHDISGDSWSAGGELVFPRSRHTATTLPDGRVLIVGGYHLFPGGTIAEPIDLVEIYDPITKQSSVVAPTAYTHQGHTATKLSDGRVVVLDDTPVAEIYDPASHSWSQLPGLNLPRTPHSTTLMTDDTILVVGGNSGGTQLTSVERYDPATGSSETLASLPTVQAGHSATRIGEQVAVVGGWLLGPTGIERLDVVHVYDPATDSWQLHEPLAVARNAHETVAISASEILVAGGASDTSEFYTTTTEVLTIPSTLPPPPTTNPWQEIVLAGLPGSSATDISWNYVMGYHFQPLVDGSVRQLGGLFAGTKEVVLWNRASGALLASATVTAANEWAYTDIDPVDVYAGSQYTVAVRLAGSGGSYQGSAGLPRDHANIRIEGTTYAYTGSNPNTRPTNSYGHTMYGQADIGFVESALPPDVIAPTVVWVAPAPYAEVSGTVTLSAAAFDDRGVERVEFSQELVPLGTATSEPFEVQWDTTSWANGTYPLLVKAFDGAGNESVADLRNVTVMNTVTPGQAVFSTAFNLPFCGDATSSCDSGTLLDGRATLGPEPNHPNAGGGCADGTAGTYHSDESIDRIVISSLDGMPLQRGGAARVDVTVYVWSPYSDYLDLFVRADPNGSDPWSYLGTWNPTVAGLETISATIALPLGANPEQVIRAQFRYGGSSSSSCYTGAFNDRDDLVFTTEPM